MLKPPPKPKAIPASSCVIDPRRSPIFAWWDGITVVALIFTALVTPYEVAFLPPSASVLDPMFLINRSVDGIFACDIILQFFIMQMVSDKYGDRWIANQQVLIRRYLSGWFVIDIFSTAISAVDVLAVLSTESGVGKLKVLRVIRVLRLIKLMRLLRGSRILSRWESKISINYAAMSLARVVLLLLFSIHWSACAWALGSSFTRPSPQSTWLEVKQLCAFEATYTADGEELFEYEPAQGNDTGWICASPFTIYVAALYWATMTITSIGYGDVVATPGNRSEQLLCTFLMLFASMLWAQVVATFCAVLSEMSASAAEYRSALDQLNRYMRVEGLPKELQWRLREYYFKTKHLRNQDANVNMLKNISPNLQYEVIWEANKKWLRQIRFLVGTSHGFICDLVLRLTPIVYAPDDIVVNNSEMIVICRGVCLYGGRVLTAGSVCAEDMLLECEALRSRSTLLALSYLETNAIDRDAIYQVLQSHPEDLRVVRKHVGFLALRRQIVLMARLERAVKSSNHISSDERSPALQAFFSNVLDAFQSNPVHARNAKSSDEGPFARSSSGRAMLSKLGTQEASLLVKFFTPTVGSPKVQARARRGRHGLASRPPSGRVAFARPDDGKLDETEPLEERSHRGEPANGIEAEEVHSPQVGSTSFTQRARALAMGSKARKVRPSSIMDALKKLQEQLRESVQDVRRLQHKSDERIGRIEGALGVASTSPTAKRSASPSSQSSSFMKGKVKFTPTILSA